MHYLEFLNYKRQVKRKEDRRDATLRYAKPSHNLGAHNTQALDLILKQPQALDPVLQKSTIFNYDYFLHLLDSVPKQSPALEPEKLRSC